MQAPPETPTHGSPSDNQPHLARRAAACAAKRVIAAAIVPDPSTRLFPQFGMNTNVLAAIFKRNFVAYFANPTGYVFICAFVVACSFAAFWPHEFFNVGLANLDQLNRWFPLVMLVFVPAITMGIWADERRQGTDELLLTIPATDVDVVMGKYLAAVAIYSASLLLSMICNLSILSLMGTPDMGLFLTNYFGYWMVGLAMLSVGMVASFLTPNLTVAFILGAAFNLLLVMTALADMLVAQAAAVPVVARWSIAYQLGDFGRGIVSLSAMSYFLAITAAMLYVSMVLIGRRHWLGGRDGSAMLGHYLSRTLGIVAASLAVVSILSAHDRRLDATWNQTNTLTGATRELLGNLHVQEIRDLDEKIAKLQQQQKQGSASADSQSAPTIERELAELQRRRRQLDQPIVVEAYVSRNVPEAFAAKRLDLLGKLREFENLARGRLRVLVHHVEPHSQAEQNARDKYDIRPRNVRVQSHGALTQGKIVLGAGLSHGTSRHVVRFFELGIPVEYELVRAIANVAQHERRTIGVVQTDADLATAFGRRDQGVLAELEKHFKVETINPREPIDVRDANDPSKFKYDALLAVQPSALGPDDLENLIDAIRQGIPTAIFEDPLPQWVNVPGTSQPRRAPRDQFMMFQPPADLPKGDISRLWQMLGVQLAGDVYPQTQVPFPGAPPQSGREAYEAVAITQQFNPYRQLRAGQWLHNGYVFVRDGMPEDEVEEGRANARAGRPFSDDPVTNGLFELLLLCPGGIERRTDAPKTLKQTSLVRTSNRTGMLRFSQIADVYGRHTGGGLPGEEPDWMEIMFDLRSEEQANRDRAMRRALQRNEKFVPRSYDLAVRITGKPAPPVRPVKEQPNPPEPAELNVILVADVDMLHSGFFQMRAQPDETQGQFLFQNVPFILNVLDSLASREQDKGFIEIRKGRERHATLGRFQSEVEKIRSEVEITIDQAAEDYNQQTRRAEQAREKADKDWEDAIARLEKAEQPNIAELRDARFRRSLAMRKASRQEDVEKERARRDRNEKLTQADAQREQQIRRLETRYKVLAVAIPPIPPLVMGLFVFLYRRSREKEGVARTRLR
jgi:ABC-2 type transport system permease protein